MQHRIFQKLSIVFASFLFLCLTAFTAKAGLDSYEIYLNNKLLLKQYVNQPLNLSSLQLTQKNAADQIVVYYNQCNAPKGIAKSRSITVRDADGKILKAWKFADASETNKAMIIPVKDLLLLEKNNAGKELSMVYAAEGRNGGQMLANFHFGQKSTVYHQLKSSGSAISYKPAFSFIQPLCL